MKLITSFYFSFGTKILSLIIILISRVLTARILGAADLGSVGTALNLTTIISRFGSMGIGPATQFTGSKFPDRKNAWLIYAMIFSVFLGILNLLLLLHFKNEILVWQFKSDSHGRYIFLKFIPWLPLIIISMTLPVFLLGAGRLKEYSFTQILPLLFQLITICIAYNRPSSIELIILAQLIYWISTVITALLFVDYRNFSFQFKSELLLIYVKYAFKAWPQVILQFGITRYAILLGSQYLTSKDLGYYILASGLSESFLILNSSITPLIFNRIASKGHDFTFLARSLRFSNLSFVLVFITIILFGKPIFLYFFGNDFYPSWNFLMLLLISAMLHGMIRICINYMAALGKNTAVSAIQLTELIALFLTAKFTCAAFGPLGLCYSSIITSIAGFLFCLFYLRKREMKRNSTILSFFLFNKEDVNILFRIVKSFRKS